MVYLYFVLFCLCPFVIFGIYTALAILAEKIHYRKYDNLKNDMHFQSGLKKKRAWWTATIMWMVTEYMFVIVPFVANVIVIFVDAFKVESTSQKVLVFSIISSAFVVFAFAINPQRHKKGYRKAFTIADYAINNYKTDRNAKALYDAIKEGESYIDVTCDIEKQ